MNEENKNVMFEILRNMKHDWNVNTVADILRIVKDMQIVKPKPKRKRRKKEMKENDIAKAEGKA